MKAEGEQGRAGEGEKSPAAPSWSSLSLSPSPLLPLSLLLLPAVLFFWQLGHRDLFSSHEARAAQNAQRMLDTGEWGLPVLFDGQVDLQKPPAFYWLVAAAGWATGGAGGAPPGPPPGGGAGGAAGRGGGGGV